MDTNPGHHAVPGRSDSVIRTTKDSPTPQLEPTMMEISTQSTILEGSLGLPLWFEEEASENTNNSNKTPNSDTCSESSDTDSTASVTPSARLIMMEIAHIELSTRPLIQKHPGKSNENENDAPPDPIDKVGHTIYTQNASTPMTVFPLKIPEQENHDLLPRTGQGPPNFKATRSSSILQTSGCVTGSAPLAQVIDTKACDKGEVLLTNQVHQWISQVTEHWSSCMGTLSTNSHQFTLMSRVLGCQFSLVSSEGD